MDDTLNQQDLGVMALEFLGNLTDTNGDIRVSMRTSLDNGMANIRVLQTAQLLETAAVVHQAAGEGSE